MCLCVCSVTEALVLLLEELRSFKASDVPKVISCSVEVR